MSRPALCERTGQAEDALGRRHAGGQDLELVRADDLDVDERAPELLQADRRGGAIVRARAIRRGESGAAADDGGGLMDRIRHADLGRARRRFLGPRSYPAPASPHRAGWCSA